MEIEKFKNELKTLKNFMELYCKHKHKNQLLFNKNIPYKQESLSIDLNLCEECHTLINYSIERLQNCPHEIKPKCRKCPNPCYEKKEWKSLAKIMRYSGMKLGFIKIKRFFS
ncbi:hypothetical protein CRV08_13725 [Halarcobacter ebronensis]|uniref:Nitrous oxide-stimulated promoter family protein n=1 Tax=Halarcobacter ebronensis TaxID=1462615 RepID=A0A4V1LQX6_9BACT|nr:nitrous oxide-stimulated promoter family protein [Halarcobacter ebronensis]RXJ66228.1 hypothetical protein CRV08_13725 [Halarcobacter ebronensis]